jgi:hypothetical protein
MSQTQQFTFNDRLNISIQGDIKSRWSIALGPYIFNTDSTRDCCEKYTYEVSHITPIPRILQAAEFTLTIDEKSTGVFGDEVTNSCITTIKNSNGVIVFQATYCNIHNGYYAHMVRVFKDDKLVCCMSL